MRNAHERLVFLELTRRVKDTVNEVRVQMDRERSALPLLFAWRLLSLTWLDSDVVPRESSSQDCGHSRREDERKLVRKPFLLSNDGCPIFFLLGPVYCLDGLPIRDVPGFSFAEDAVEHACRAEQPDMSTMERSQGTSSALLLLREKDGRCLAVMPTTVPANPQSDRAGVRGRQGKPARLSARRIGDLVRTAAVGFRPSLSPRVRTNGAPGNLGVL